MSGLQTEANFAANLNTIFRINLETQSPIELKLIDVKRHLSEEHKRPDMERFSVFFSGPLEFFLPQQTYPLVHEKMGEFEIFLVPIGKEPDGFRYEAVYNYFKSADEQKNEEVP